MLGLEAKGQVFRDRFLIADVKMQARVSDRALVLVRPAVPSQPVGAPAPSGRRRLAHRLPARLGRRSRSRAAARARHSPHPVQCSGPTTRSSSNGSASTPSAASAWSGFVTGACSSSATPRTRCRRSARAARTAASRMPTTSPGSWRSCSRAVATDALLDSYDAERIPAADENILNSTRSTDFITPKSAVSRTFRDATLQLAEKYPFARKLVNSGRLSLPHTYRHSPLDTLDHDSFADRVTPGRTRARCSARQPGRAGLAAGSARRRVRGGVLLGRATAAAAGPDRRPEERAACRPAHRRLRLPAARRPLACPPTFRSSSTSKACSQQRYDAAPGSLYLFRPDQHLTARWRHLDLNAVRSAVSRAACLREAQTAA